jgi:hypothetical protein
MTGTRVRIANQEAVLESVTHLRRWQEAWEVLRLPGRLFAPYLNFHE